jgi:hypothetical protein
MLESYLVDFLSHSVLFHNEKEREKQREKREKLIGVVLGSLKLWMMATSRQPHLICGDTCDDISVLWRFCVHYCSVTRNGDTDTSAPIFIF